MKYSICYETITEESAQDGDFADHGFYDAGWKYSLNEESVIEDLKENPNLYRILVKMGELRSIFMEIERLGIVFDGDSFRSIDPDIDYSTGEETFYSFHMSEITDSTYNRIVRLYDNPQTSQTTETWNNYLSQHIQECRRYKAKI